jgi:hypothetical protein
MSQSQNSPNKRPDVTVQTEFSFDQGEEEDEPDSFGLETKDDEPIDTALTDFFSEVGEDANRARETEIQAPDGCNIFQDLRDEIRSRDEFEQKQLVRDIAEENQLDLTGEEVEELTEVVRKAAIKEDTDEKSA